MFTQCSRKVCVRFARDSCEVRIPPVFKKSRMHSTAKCCRDSISCARKTTLCEDETYLKKSVLAQILCRFVPEGHLVTFDRYIFLLLLPPRCTFSPVPYVTFQPGGQATRHNLFPSQSFLGYLLLQPPPCDPTPSHHFLSRTFSIAWGTFSFFSRNPINTLSSRIWCGNTIFPAD